MRDQDVNRNDPLSQRRSRNRLAMESSAADVRTRQKVILLYAESLIWTDQEIASGQPHGILESKCVRS